jgi:hypothetical protein
VNYTINNNSGNTGALSGGTAINIKTDNADIAGSPSNGSGTIQGNTIGTSGVAGSGASCSGGCSGIAVNQRHGGTLTANIIGNTIQNVDSHAIFATGGESYTGNAGKLEIVITGNLIRQPAALATVAVEIRSGALTNDTSCVTATIGNSLSAPAGNVWPSTTAGAQNRIEGNWDPTPGGTGNEIFLWERYTNTSFFIPGLSGGAVAHVTARNSITSADGTNVASAGTFTAGSCP